jgi:ferrous iron transport protein A
VRAWESDDGRVEPARPARLDELADGAHATVVRVHGTSPVLDEAMLRRLVELGFIAGEPVQVLRRGPGGREPLAVRVGDTLFALRLAEARCIEVTGAPAARPISRPAPLGGWNRPAGPDLLEGA